MPPTTPPIAQSPLTEWHRCNHATLELRDGWRVAVEYPDEPRAGANVLIDLAHRPTWELNGPRIAQRLIALSVGDLAVRTIAVREGLQVYRLTHRRAIIFGTPADQIDGALDVTGGWVSLALVGPESESILNKITAVDLRERTLPKHGCCQGPIFGVNTLFGRFNDRFELHMCGGSAEFLWEVLLDAGKEFDLKPAGVDYPYATAIV